VPVVWAIAVGQTPQLCARHGEPAEEMRGVRFREKPLPWALISVSLGLLGGFACGPAGAVIAWTLISAPLGVLMACAGGPAGAVMAAGVGRRLWPGVEAEAWPYCVRCVALHRVCAIGMATGVFGIMSNLIGALRMATGTLDGVAMVLAAGGLVVGLIGFLIGDRFSWRKLGGAQASMDRLYLHVDGHGRFAADIRARIAAEQALNETVGHPSRQLQELS
jgi:hypothetical protein